MIGTGSPSEALDARAAVVIAAHNEELTLAATLESVLETYAPDDVFLFDDASADRTSEIAEQYLSERNVIRHPVNIGKSRGLEYTLDNHVYPAGYTFVTILDADTTLEPQYRDRALAGLEDDEVVCAAGQVKSRPEHNLIAVYRTWLYFIWQMVFKRIQSKCDAIAIAPGCASTWRVSALRQIRFDHRMSTEDFHLSVAVHRQRLGRIKYVPAAVVWTQDPHTLRAFVRQTFRWNRAWWEAVRTHRVGLFWFRRGPDGRVRISALDIVNALIILSLVFFFVRVLAIPVLMVLPIEPPEIIYPGGREALIVHLALQVALMMVIVLIAAAFTRSLPMALLASFVVALVVVEFFNSMRALLSVLHRPFPQRPVRGASAASSAWDSPERRRIAPPGSWGELPGRSSSRSSKERSSVSGSPLTEWRSRAPLLTASEYANGVASGARTPARATAVWMRDESLGNRLGQTLPASGLRIPGGKE